MKEALASASVRNRVNSLGLRAAQLAGRRSSDLERQKTLTSQVADAKGRMGLGPQVASVFEGMQHLAHQRSVGSLEALLSAILKDVLPDEGAIRLLPSYKANNTHLDVMLDKAGALEDVLDGNGGAVTNVVCAGLRFAALSRTGNRRLMVMDEPDCWVSLDRVPEFARTISQVAQKGRFQTLVITHKQPSFFEGHYNIVRFAQDANGKVEATALSPLISQWESDAQPGIRKIELINVRRHEHTVVPCFPGPTVYVGKSNLGKSTALMTSLKAVAYGESDDSLIRHGCEEARIIFHLENGQRLEWSRHVKRSPSVLYKHFKGEALVAEGRPKTRNQAPEWVTELMGVSRVDDLDIQVGNQKTPVFLLNDSAPRRAQILSVGRESSHLPGLMRAYEQMKAADREAIKQGESELSRLRLRLTYLEKVPPLAERHAALAARAEEVVENMAAREQLSMFLERVEQRSVAIAKLEAVVNALERTPALPVLADAVTTAQVVSRLERAHRKLGGAELPELPEPPVLHDLRAIADFGARIRRAQSILAVAKAQNTELPAAPVLQDAAALKALIDALTQKDAMVRSSDKLVAGVTSELNVATAQLNELIDELGQACPLCGGAISHQHTPEKDTCHA